MDRDRRIEMEVTVATEIAKTLLSEWVQFLGKARDEMAREVPGKAAQCAHELVEHVLRNNPGTLVNASEIADREHGWCWRRRESGSREPII